MDFHALLAKMKAIDSMPTAAPVDQIAQECSDPMMSQSTMTPPMSQMTPPPTHPSMSVNLNAQGMDNIEQMMKLFQKVNPDMMPKMPAPMSSMTTPPSIASITPEIPPLKMLPDFDLDNNDKIGGEIELDKPDTPDTAINLPPEHDKDHEIVKTLDRDGDGDHDMDDHQMKSDDDSESEPKKEDGGFQSATTEPEERYKSIDYMNNKLAGGMNRPKSTFPKVSDGDNPMQKVKESEDAFRASIRADLQRRLNEAKGVK
jgi:hypothetical protein